MRHLNKKQKKMLDKWYEKHSDLPGLGVFHLEDCEEFTCEFLEELRAVNDFEILCSCINRYVSDIEMEENNKTKTIRACWELVKKYRNPKGRMFFSIRDCPLCKIHENTEDAVRVRDARWRLLWAE